MLETHDIIFLKGIWMRTRSRRTIIRHPRHREPILWIIDSEQWPRACLRAELIERGYNPYGFITVTDALDALSRGTSPKPAALVLELRGQNVKPEAIETIRNLRIPTILLGGNSELNDPLIKQHQWHTTLQRPFSLGSVADLVEKIVPSLV
jgi:DNA-binding NtrC family response regulator